MSEIRPLEDENAGSEQNDIISGNDERRLSITMQQLQVFVTRTVEQVLEQHLVPSITSVVKREIGLAQERILTSLKQNNGSGLHSLESRSFQLEFLNKLSLPVFTGNIIKGEGSTPIRVALVDAITKQVVKSGPEASAKVHIVAVEGDFDGDKRSNWKPEEFNNKIAKEKPGRRSLLIGNLDLYLKEGIGVVGDISFTHNSNWLQMCKLRLGAKVGDNLNGPRVREAITESFIVKDKRSTYRGKHHHLSLDDEVWRVKNIGKDGPFHKCLDRENIKSVKDFLIQCFINPQRLRDILGRSMRAKMWEVTVDHARTIFNKRFYLYFPLSSQKKTGVVFKEMGQVTELLSEGQSIPIDKLPETGKAEAHKLVISAFEHMAEVKSFDDETSLKLAALHLFNARPSNSPRLESPNSSYFEGSPTNDGHDQTLPSASSNTNEVFSFGDDTSLMDASFNGPYCSYSLGLENPGDFNYGTSHVNDGYDFNQPSTSVGINSFDQSFGGPNDLNDYSLHSAENAYLECDQPLSFQGGFSDPLSTHTESTAQALFEEEHLPFFYTNHSFQSQNSNLQSQGDLHSIVYHFLSARAAAAVAKSQRSWTMLFSVLRWFSIRKIVALKSVVLNSVASERIHAPKRPRIN